MGRSSSNKKNIINNKLYFLGKKKKGLLKKTIPFLTGRGVITTPIPVCSFQPNSYLCHGLIGIEYVVGIYYKTKVKKTG